MAWKKYFAKQRSNRKSKIHLTITKICGLKFTHNKTEHKIKNKHCQTQKVLQVSFTK